MGDCESCEVEITIGEPGDPTDVVDAVNEGTYLQALQILRKDVLAANVQPSRWSSPNWVTLYW